MLSSDYYEAFGSGWCIVLLIYTEALVTCMLTFSFAIKSLKRLAVLPRSHSFMWQNLKSTHLKSVFMQIVIILKFYPLLEGTRQRSYCENHPPHF